METSRETLTIIAGQSEKQYFKDLIRYRELFYFFAWRDILVRYKQTYLGFLWALIRPLLNIAILSFVFGKVAHLASENISYPLFVLAGMIPWQLFSNSLIDTSLSLVNNASMISKIYFPRVILPVSYIIAHFVDFLISLALMFIVFGYAGYLNHWSLLTLPFFIGLTLLFSLGTSLWLAAVSVRFRDFRFIVPFIIQFGIFLSPVGYSGFLLTGSWRWLYFLNPMAGIIEGFRFACFDVYHPDLPLALSLSTAVNLLVLIAGFRFFRKMERICGDIV